MTSESHAGRTNVRSAAFMLALTVRPCVSCARLIELVAIALPTGHEWLEESAWHSAEEPAFLFEIEWLEGAVQSMLQERCPQFHQGAGSGAAEDVRWLNHCHSCGMAQDDDNLHGELGGAFLPAAAEEAASIELLSVQQPFSAIAWGLSDAAHWLDAMRRDA